ncbi:MAG TPA: hypothetical protein PLY36_08935 [Spirochaetota bacterium]|nr:hypothetical protein [Spirochaetota bacterium]
MKRSIFTASVLSLIMFTSIVSAQSTPKEVKLNPAEKKQLNTFFSNFSEVFVKPFKKDAISDTELIEFSVSHNYRNNEKLFVKGGEEYQVKIKASYIDNSAVKFFGRNIKKNQSIAGSGIEYRDGWYFTTDASGEEYYFSQIVSLSDDGNNMYTAIVNVYAAGSGWTGNVHGDAKEWKKTSPEDVPEISEVIKATLRKVTEKGKGRYILIDYLKEK